MLDDFDFSPQALIAGLIFGVVGLWLFREGRKNLNFRVMITGIAIMSFQLFVKGWVQTWGIGLGLCGLAYYFWNHE